MKKLIIAVVIIIITIATFFFVKNYLKNKENKRKTEELIERLDYLKKTHEHSLYLISIGKYDSLHTNYTDSEMQVLPEVKF